MVNSKWSWWRRLTHREQGRLPWRTVVYAALGAGVTIGLLALLNQVSGMPALEAAFGSSCILVFLMPQAPVSQPINVIGGHLLSALIGVAVRAVMPTTWWSLGLAVALSLAVMAILRVTHPPAGGDPIAILLSDAGWLPLMWQIALGTLIIVTSGALSRYLMRSVYRDPRPDSQTENSR